LTTTLSPEPAHKRTGGIRLFILVHTCTCECLSMDEVFWSNVVKRWSDASENVILLKKELARVQEEVRACLRPFDSGRDYSHTSAAHPISEGSRGSSPT
jgi:hypothetical protein